MDICARVEEAFEQHRSVMLQMPTGTGKTVVLAELVQRFLCLDPDGSVVIVAHRMELIEQIERGIIAHSSEPSTHDTCDNKIRVYSVQWLYRNISEVERRPSLVVIDEAHHAVAESYRLLWESWPQARFLGLTATPYRLSGEGFTELFEVLVGAWSVKRFIGEGWLSTFDYFSIRPESEEQQMIDALRKRGADGDFQMKELHEKLDVTPCIERLFESFMEFTPEMKGIIYAIDIAHAEHIADYYQRHGVKALAISSKTPREVRRRLIGEFKASLIQVLVSVDLFSEGFDCPDVEFIQLARPTLSLGKYLQMVGRGLRPAAGKSCCTIVDNVGLYRRFGLPSEEREWEQFFLGMEHETMLGLEGNEQFFWLRGSMPTREGNGEVVKIVSHEGMQSQFAKMHKTGFERRKKGKQFVWVDRTNGVEFDSLPKVVNYYGVELSSADGEEFFPRIRSKWIDAKHGINRKALETQVGEGLGWMRLYVSPTLPDKVLQLQEVKPNQARIYKDERGKVYLQQDLDHAPIGEQEAGGKRAFMARCDELQRTWLERANLAHGQSLEFDEETRWWRLPEGCTQERVYCSGMEELELYHIIYKVEGECKEYWLDGETGFIYNHRPVVRERGFVRLLFDGELVYILNIHEERFMPYRNWEIRADEQLCAIGSKLYFSDRREGCAYRIKRRSDDFRMFVVENRYPSGKSDTIKYEELMVINKAGKRLEIKAYSDKGV